MEQAIQTARNQQLHKLHRRLRILGLSINLTLLERKDLWYPQRHRLLDGIDWLKLLDDQLELAKANGILQLSEHGGNLAALRRTMIRNHEPFNGGPKEPPELKGRAWKPLPATDAMIFGENHYAFVRPDAAASDSRAVMMKTVKHTWWVQLSKLPEGEYDIYGQVRCEGNAPKGDAVLLDIINNASQDPQRKPHITVAVPATSISGNDYKLIRIGRTDVKSYFCLYAAPMVNPTLNAVWIDRFILVEPKD